MCYFHFSLALTRKHKAQKRSLASHFPFLLHCCLPQQLLLSTKTASITLCCSHQRLPPLPSATIYEYCCHYSANKDCPVACHRRRQRLPPSLSHLTTKTAQSPFAAIVNQLLPSSPAAGSWCQPPPPLPVSPPPSSSLPEPGRFQYSGYWMLLAGPLLLINMTRRHPWHCDNGLVNIYPRGLLSNQSTLSAWCPVLASVLATAMRDVTNQHQGNTEGPISTDLSPASSAPVHAGLLLVQCLSGGEHKDLSRTMARGGWLCQQRPGWCIALVVINITMPLLLPMPINTMGQPPSYSGSPRGHLASALTQWWQRLHGSPSQWWGWSHCLQDPSTPAQDFWWQPRGGRTEPCGLAFALTQQWQCQEGCNDNDISPPSQPLSSSPSTASHCHCRYLSQSPLTADHGGASPWPWHNIDKDWSRGCEVTMGR